MGNYTYNSFTLQLEGLKVSDDSMYPAFFFFLISYLFIMFSNVGIVFLVFTEKSLHQPMYLLFCNLPINDIIGNSIMMPRLLADMLLPPSERLISYYECVVQAFIIHMFSTTSHTILMIMSFDRYVAICNPLRYATIMNKKMVIKLTVSAWGVAFVLVGILLGLTIRLNRCRTLISHPFCDNASLFKLSCESVFINNVYGLTFTVVLLTASIGSMILTYSKITAVCLTRKNKSLNSKALQTCSTHLSVFMIMFLSGMVVIILHRFPKYSDYRKLAAILFYVVPSGLNPIIYGVQSAEIRRFLSNVFQFRKNNDESAYREEVQHLSAWCIDNNLALNTKKTKDLIVDFRESKHKWSPRRVHRIAKDSSHASHKLFTRLPSGRRYRSLLSKTSQFRNSFFPSAVTLLNSAPRQ
ncbi:olfactory receptor 52K1-like [Diretmus argenteus]